MEGTLVRPQEPPQTTSQEELGFPHNRPLNSVGLYFPIRSICILGSQQSAAIGLVTDAGVPCKSREEKGLVLSTREGGGEIASSIQWCITFFYFNGRQNEVIFSECLQEIKQIWVLLFFQCLDS